MALHHNHGVADAQNVPEQVVRAEFFADGSRGVHGAEVVYEHGQTWVHCPECGAQWGVSAVKVGRRWNHVDFTELYPGDESCLETAFYAVHREPEDEDAEYDYGGEG